MKEETQEHYLRSFVLSLLLLSFCVGSTEQRGGAVASTSLLHNLLCVRLSGFNLNEPQFCHSKLEMLALTSGSAYEDS